MEFGVKGINPEGMEVYRSSDGRWWRYQEELDLGSERLSLLRVRGPQILESRGVLSSDASLQSDQSLKRTNQVARSSNHSSR